MAHFASRLIQIKSGEEVQLRMAHVSEAPVLMEVFIRFAETSPYILSTVESRRARSLESQETWIQNSNEQAGDALIVADYQGRIIGVTNMISFKDVKRAHRAGLGMTMDPDYRGKGLGEAMLRMLIEIAKTQSHLRFLELNVMGPNQAAFNLYKKLGFQECGRQTEAYHLEDGRWVDDIAMILPLRP